MAERSNLLDRMVVIADGDDTSGTNGLGNEGNLLDRIFACQSEQKAARRARQVENALEALDEMKKRNSAYPTEKRSRMIRFLEKRFREEGILHDGEGTEGRH